MEAVRDLFPAPTYDLRLYPVEMSGGLAAKWRSVRRPYSFSFSPALEHDFRACLAEGFDVLHLEQLWSGYLGLDHVARSLLNVHYLMAIDLGEAEGFGWLSKERRLAFPAERRMLRRFPHIRTCTPRLEEAVRAINPTADVTSVPLGLDLALYPYIPAARCAPGVPNVTLIGSMNWMPGRSAALRLLNRLWPEIVRRVPTARLNIIGWEARTVLCAFLDMPSVTIVENVPDTRSYFEAAGVLVYAPERGCGMKIKILEAMAYGVPVVTTAEGVEGLPAEDGVHAGICEDDAGLIERTVALLNDRSMQERQRLPRGNSWCAGVLRIEPWKRSKRCTRGSLAIKATERRRSGSVAEVMLKRIAILGAGGMGTVLAVLFAKTACAVTLWRATPTARPNSKDAVRTPAICPV